jgi:hypothetical protein
MDTSVGEADFGGFDGGGFGDFWFFTWKELLTIQIKLIFRNTM